MGERQVETGVVRPALERHLEPLLDRADGWVRVPLGGDWDAYVVCGAWSGKNDPRDALFHILGVLFLPTKVPPSRRLNSSDLRVSLTLDSAPDEVFAEGFRGSLSLIAGSLERREVTPEQWNQVQEAIRDTRIFEKKLRAPKQGQHKEDDFYPMLASKYLEHLGTGGPRRIAVRLYEHLNSEGFDGSPYRMKSPQAVSDSLKACRARGYLSKPGKGRSASEVTPKLLEWQAEHASVGRGRKR